MDVPMPDTHFADCRLTVREALSEDWDTFVMQAPDASLYHLTGWTELARRGLRAPDALRGVT